MKTLWRLLKTLALVFGIRLIQLIIRDLPIIIALIVIGLASMPICWAVKTFLLK